MKKLRVLSVVMALLMLICSFTGCSNFRGVKQWGKEDEKTEEHVTDTSKLNVNLVEMTSTGEIPYDKFKCYTGNLCVTDTDLFPFMYNSKYGYADATGKVIITEKYDEALMFSENKAFVRIGEQWKIIDTSGKELYTIPDEYFEAVDYFEGTTSFFKNGKAVFANKTDIEGSEDEAGIPKEMLKVLVVYEDMHTEEIEIKAECYLKYKIVNTAEFSGFVVYSVDRLQSGFNQQFNIPVISNIPVIRLFGLNGKEIWKCVYKEEFEDDGLDIGIEYFKAMGREHFLNDVTCYDSFCQLSVASGYMNVFDENGKWGLLNVKTGELEIEYKYDFVGGYSEGLCNVCSYGKWGYINLEGTEVIQPKYKYTGPFVNGYAMVIAENGSYLNIDVDENVVYETDDVLETIDSTQHNVIEVNLGKADLCVTYKNYRSAKVLNCKGEIILYCQDDAVAVTDNYVFTNSKMYKIVK